MAVLQLKKNGKPIKDKQGRSWYFKTYYTTLSGERKQYKSKKYISKHDAEEAERVFLMTLTDKIEYNSITFLELKNLYLDFQKDRVKITTYYSYYKHFKYIDYLNNVKVKDFDIYQFNLWKKEISKNNLSTRYKNNIYKFFRGVLNYAIRYLDIDLNNILNKMTGFANPNETKNEMLFWTYDEFKTFINLEKELKYKVFFELLYYCGLRKGEANALNWNDIDFQKHLININKSITLKIKGEAWFIIPPKTKSSNRILPMSNKLENDLKLLYNEYNKYANFKKNWFVFGGTTPLKDSTITKRKHDICKNNNLKEIRIHDFRHSCASLLISNGASIALVAKYLGHSNITTTLNTYTHMFKSELNDIVNLIDNL